MIEVCLKRGVEQMFVVLLGVVVVMESLPLDVGVTEQEDEQ